MNPFGNFQFNQYQQQFAPLPAQDIIKTGELMNQEYFKNQALMDKTQQAIDSISVFDEDAGVKKEQLESYQRTLQSIMDNGGGFEMAGEAARNLARQVARNKQLSSAASNYKQYQALMEEADKMDVSDYQTAKIRALKDNYKGVGLKDEFGKYKSIGSVDFYKEHDIMKEVSDFLKGAKASQTVTMTDDGYWKVKGTQEKLTEQELMQYGFNMVAKNPKYRRQMQDMARFRASDGDLTNEITSEQFSNAYNTIARELVSPAAGAYSYFRNNLDYKYDAVKGKGAIDAKEDLRNRQTGRSEIIPMEVPTFEENYSSYKESNARLESIKKRIAEGESGDEVMTELKDATEKNNRLKKSVYEEMEAITNEMNSAYGLGNVNGKDESITPEKFIEMMDEYGEGTSFSKQMGNLFEGVKALFYDMTPAGMQLAASGKSSSELWEERTKVKRESMENKFSEEQRKAFDDYFGRGGRGSMGKRFKNTRAGKREEAKTKSRDTEVLFLDKKESQYFAPYILEEANRVEVQNVKGEVIDPDDLKGYQVDNTRNISIASKEINGKRYITLPMKNEDGEQTEVLIDGNQSTLDGSSLFVSAQGLLKRRADGIKENMQYMNQFEQQQAKTFLNAVEPVLDPKTSENLEFIESSNNLGRRDRTVKGANSELKSYGSVEKSIGQTGFVKINNVGGAQGKEFYIGSKGSDGEEYIFSFDDNSGNDSYGTGKGKQNGIVKDYFNVEGTSNIQENTNNAIKAKRMKTMEQSINFIDNNIPTNGGINNFHAMAKLSEYSRDKSVSLSSADEQQLQKLNMVLGTFFEANDLDVNVPVLDKNNQVSVENTLKFYNQSLQLIAERYEEQ